MSRAERGEAPTASPWRAGCSLKKGELNMFKRTLLCAAFAMGCAGSNSNTKSDKKPCCAEAQTAEAAPPAAPKLHGPKKRIGIVDFDDASHHGYWGGSRNALAE